MVIFIFLISYRYWLCF